MSNEQVASSVGINTVFSGESILAVSPMNLTPATSDQKPTQTYSSVFSIFPPAYTK